MDWQHDGDVMTATGQYDRAYRVEPFQGRWRAKSGHEGRSSNVFTAKEDAVKWCDCEEQEMRKG